MKEIEFGKRALCDSFRIVDFEKKALRKINVRQIEGKIRGSVEMNGF